MENHRCADLYFPEDHQNAQGVHRILTLDWISRKDRHWPLLDYTCIDPFFSTDPTLSATPTLPTLHYLKAPFSPRQRRSQADILQQAFRAFPALPHILSRHSGKVALCGGLLCRLACGRSINSNVDCDLFFYGHDAESSADSLDEYRSILEDCVATISSSCSRASAVFVTRSEHVVSVVVHLRWGSMQKYQLILRLYARLDLILGGFDLGPAMIGFDGERLLTTQLGAWSLAKGAMIVDTTRRSSSYEYRLRKYYGFGFSVVLPGLDMDVMVEDCSAEGLRERMLSVGLRFIGRDIVEEVEPVVSYSLNGVIGIVARDREMKIVVARRRRRMVPIEQRLLPEQLMRYSDYMPFDPNQLLLYETPEKYSMFMLKYYTTILKIGAREKLLVCSKLPCEYKKARKQFSEMIDHPKIQLDAHWMEKHSEWLKEYVPLREGKYYFDPRHEYRLFAEYFVEFEQLLGTFCEGRGEKRYLKNTFKDDERYLSFISKVTEELNRRILERSKAWAEEFKGLRWRTQNPGSQHTASFNPILEDPREFYKNCYKPFTIGIPNEVETCIWLIFNIQFKFPREIVKLIVRNVVKSNAQTCPTYPKITKEEREKIDTIRNMHLVVESESDDNSDNSDQEDEDLRGNQRPPKRRYEGTNSSDSEQKSKVSKKDY